MAGLPPRAMAPSVRLLARWGLSPRVDWPTARRRLALGLRFPPPPRGTQIRPLALGGVPCEEVRPAGALDESAALVYFHGGGYVVCTPADYRGLTALIAAAFGARVIAVDYRLAPEHPHPAAFDDARAVWRAVSDELGLAPERVAVAGDSAGGGLTLALALGLRDAGAPLPAALGLIAPWLDLARDVDGTRPPDPGDVLLNRALLRRFALAYLANGTPADALAVSPLHADLRGLPPLIVHTSEHDLLRGDGEAFVTRAKRAGLSVEHEQLPELWHDPHISARLLAEPGGGAPARLGTGLRALLAEPGTDTLSGVGQERITVGEDGVARCSWGDSTPDYRHYHDTEWGFPVVDDIRLFEKLSLEGFQAGLAWITILRKREAFRAAFAGFDFTRVAEFGPADVERMLGDAGIVRHRGKIEAVINNAGRAVELVSAEGSLAHYAWSFEPEPVPRVELLSETAASRAMAKDLKRRGWKFVGPTTVYAFMQAMGLVNDHADGCAARPQVDRARAGLTRP